MTCATIRDKLLEAELGELRGHGDSPVSRHVRTCPACRELADRVVYGERALAMALAELRPRVDGTNTGAALTRSPRHARRFSAVWASVAVAAGITAILFARSGRGPAPTNPVPEPRRGQVALPIVEAPAGRNVAVLNTGNPDIVVVWFF